MGRTGWSSAIGVFAVAATTFAAADAPAAVTRGPYGKLSGVSCTSADACIGVGNFQTVGSAGRTYTLAEKWDGKSWTVLPAADPTGADGSDLYSVSCTASDACMAVGDYETGLRTLPLAEVWNGRTWTIRTTPAVTSYGRFTRVSCSSSNACVATGFAIRGKRNNWFAEVWNGRSWTVTAAPRPTGTTYSNLLGVSCVSRTLCMAVGEYQVNNSAKSRTLAERWNGRRWRMERTPNPRSGASGGNFQAVSCSSAHACTAVGGYTKLSNKEGSTLAEVWNGRTWRIRPSRNSREWAGGILVGVSCRSGSSCMAVGSYSNRASSGSGTLAEMWNGQTWTIKSTPASDEATASSLNDVSCGSQDSCVAVGDHTTEPAPAGMPLAESWNGSAWTSTTVPLQA